MIGITGKVRAVDGRAVYLEIKADNDVDLSATAYGFMRSLGRYEDVHPVSSFIARKGDPDFESGSWVLAVEIDDDKALDKIKAGKVETLSLAVKVQKRAQPSSVNAEAVSELRQAMWSGGLRSVRRMMKGL